MVRALAEATSGKGVATTGTGRWAAFVAPIVIAATALAIWTAWPDPPPLDLNRIVAFPFEVSGTPGEEEPDGALVAYHIVQALDQLGGVRWSEGKDLLELRYREDPRLVTEHVLREAARSYRAGYFLDGTVLYRGDTARVMLALHSTEDEMRVARADTADRRSDTEHVAYRAVADVLLSLIPDAGRLGVAALAGRGHETLQPFAQAERAFYYGRYRQAFEHYSSAVEADSTFALAAVKGAQAASWMHEPAAATELITVAMAHVETLPSLWASFARGFDAYLGGSADSAVLFFEKAIALDDEWPEGWMGLGEAYQHMLPSMTPQDSLAKHAFQNVYALTSGYAPALYHLAEYAIRDGDLERASEILEEYRDVHPDTGVLAIPELALACLRDSPDAIRWRRQVLDDVNRVYLAATILGVQARFPDCASAGWQAVLDHDTSTIENWRFSSLVGLQSMLAATGRSTELKNLVDSAAASGALSGATGRLYYILDAMAGAEVEPEARAVATSLREAVGSLTPARRWFLGMWDVHQGVIPDASRSRDVLQERADSGDRAAALMAEGLAGHIALAQGDTSQAVQILSHLTPNVAYAFLQRPWESFGYERVILARILLSQGRFAEAYDVAAAIDSPGAASLMFLVFLPTSLELRLRAAEALGDDVAAGRMRERLRLLGRADILDAQRP
jgi:tetratricopeptide (TPR) repeat protein